MGNSTITLQNVVDGVSIIGDLSPVLTSTGGYAAEPALTIGNDVVGDLFSVRFPWKWNRMKIHPFTLTTGQQDYASLSINNIGWCENGVRIDIKNTQIPPPSWPIVAVRDLDVDNAMAGWPGQFCWFPNDQLEQGTWPGPYVVYTNPLSIQTTPDNYLTNILDAQGNILVLTGWGVTGDVAPVAPPWTDTTNPEPDDWPIGQVIEDGTCQWTVADPQAQGFRFYPRSPYGGQVWLVRLFVQKKAPYFTRLNQKLDPIPNDQSKWFRDGFIAYAHRYSANPQVKARFEQMHQHWMQAMAQETKQNDREDESKGFYPDQGIMSPSYVQDQGPYPYRWGWR